MGRPTARTNVRISIERRRNARGKEERTDRDDGVTVRHQPHVVVEEATTEEDGEGETKDALEALLQLVQPRPALVRKLLKDLCTSTNFPISLRFLSKEGDRMQGSATYVVLAEGKDWDKIRSSSNRELDEALAAAESEVGGTGTSRERLGSATDNDSEGRTGT